MALARVFKGASQIMTKNPVKTGLFTSRLRLCVLCMAVPRRSCHRGDGDITSVERLRDGMSFLRTRSLHPRYVSTQVEKNQKEGSRENETLQTHNGKSVDVRTDDSVSSRKKSNSQTDNKDVLRHHDQPERDFPKTRSSHGEISSQPKSVVKSHRQASSNKSPGTSMLTASQTKSGSRDQSEKKTSLRAADEQSTAKKKPGKPKKNKSASNPRTSASSDWSDDKSHLPKRKADHLGSSPTNSNLTRDPRGPRQDDTRWSDGQLLQGSSTSSSSVTTASATRNPTAPTSLDVASSSPPPQVELGSTERGTNEEPSSGINSSTSDSSLEDAGRSPKDPKFKLTKSGKRRKRHNWSIVNDPAFYLQPFMDVCIYCDMLNEAQVLFDSARQHNQVLTSRHYNVMLQAWARKGDIRQVRSLFSQMALSGVKPDLQSYAAMLECLARMSDREADIARECLSEMETAGFSIGAIFEDCVFTNDQREVTLAFLRDIIPGFQTPIPKWRPRCQMKIVKELYGGKPAQVQAVAVGDKEIEAEYMKNLERQMNIEMKETVLVTSIEQELPPSAHTQLKRSILEEHRQLWRQSLLACFKYELRKLHRRNKLKGTVGKINYYPFLRIMEPEIYVDLMLETLRGLATSTEGSMTVLMSRELGNRVQRKFRIRHKIEIGVADKIGDLYKSYVRHSLSAANPNHRESWQALEDSMQQGPSLNSDLAGWPSNIALGLGSILADIMIRELKINVNMSHTKREKKLIPALYYMYTYRSFKQVGYVKPHPLLVDLLQQAKEPDIPFESNLLPMISQPIPWTSTSFGAYPLSSSQIVRCKEGTLQHKLLLEKGTSSNLYPVLDSLNQLASISWIVNKPVLDVIIGVFKSGGSHEMNICQRPDSLLPVPKPTGEMTRDELAKIQQQRVLLRKQQAEMHSLRMDMLYKLSIANKYRDDIIWFPHNMDFRGRVYPFPPHFNHMGNDVTRSILLFAKGLPLGERGLDWLKTHLVNLTGHKKRCSIADRLAYANEMLPEILDSADNPLDGNGWWKKADDKWQALACCMEIKQALKQSDPSTHVSHLPVHQDGSCNGLQHYAALGRDVIGAEQVNLCASDVPHDVYSGVAQMVEEIRQKDAANGLYIAKLLEGHIERKVVKQTVMTVVYGVTVFGGKLQIYKQLKEIPSIPASQVQMAAGYLVRIVFESIRQMFTKTREIQDWLTQCAWLIAKAGHAVEWVTPLRLPVVQPYHKKNLRVITHADHIMYHEDSSDSTEWPDSKKQKNAFPPNFVHSLDSTHMMLTSLHCHRHGVTFASVHDCFWTHACSVPLMNRICREQFVRLHSEPILQNLATFLREKYGHLDIIKGAKVLKTNPDMKTVGEFIDQVPSKGEFDLRNVLDSTFFFS